MYLNLALSEIEPMVAVIPNLITKPHGPVSTWTLKVRRTIASYRYWAIVLLTFEGLGKPFKSSEASAVTPRASEEYFNSRGGGSAYTKPKFPKHLLCG